MGETPYFSDSMTDSADIATVPVQVCEQILRLEVMRQIVLHELVADLLFRLARHGHLAQHRFEPLSVDEAVEHTGSTELLSYARSIGVADLVLVEHGGCCREETSVNLIERIRNTRLGRLGREARWKELEEQRRHLVDEK